MGRPAHPEPVAAKAILKAASIQKRTTKIKSLINEFQYPRLGPGQMWEMTGEKLEELGGVIHMNTKVKVIEQDEDGRIRAVRARGPDGE